MDERQEVKSLKKALRVLVFLNRQTESTVTEVACAIGVPRTTAYRLLETLDAEGYVEKQPHSDIYRLTSRVRRLSSGFGDDELAVEVASPLIHKVGAEIGWPLAMATPRGANMIVRVSTDHDTSRVIDRYTIGFSTPMLNAPTGFCYFAHCDLGERESILEQAECSGSNLRAFHDNDYRSFMVNQVRNLGFCHMRFAEYREGGLAVPLIVSGRAVGGIIMRYMKSMPRSVKVEEVYVPILQKLSSDISVAYEAHQKSSEPQSLRFTRPFTASTRTQMLSGQV
jgi:IclR family mhp operon transcriptional activator